MQSTKCVIYCRISTNNQMTGHSLENQESTIKNFAVNNKFKVTSIIKDIGSAYLAKPGELNKLSEINNTNVLIFSVDRFSRNVEEGTIMARRFITNKNTLYFIREEFLINATKGKNWDLFLERLQTAQNESKAISDRMKSIKKYAKDNNLYTGGVVPYGLKVKRENKIARLVVAEETRNIIKLILCAKRGNTTIDKLAEYLKNNGADMEKFPIKSEKKTIDKGLGFKEIADLLNDYLIPYLGDRKWQYSNVSATYNRFAKMKEFAPRADDDTDSDADMDTKTAAQIAADDEAELLLRLSRSLVIDWKNGPEPKSSSKKQKKQNDDQEWM